MATIDTERRYSTAHEWISKASTSDTRAIVGISAVATEALGELVYLDLPEKGSTITAGASCGEIESTKSVSDIVAPVSGTVTNINTEAVEDPALVNKDPYGSGWLFEVEVQSEGPLLTPAEYAEQNGMTL